MKNFKKVLSYIALITILFWYLSNLTNAETITVTPDTWWTFTEITNTTWVFKPSISLANDWTHVIWFIKDNQVLLRAYNNDNQAITTSDVVVDNNTGLWISSSKVLVKMHPITWNFIVAYHKMNTDSNGNKSVDVFYKVYSKPTSWTLTALSWTTPKLLNTNTIWLNTLLKITIDEINWDWYLWYSKDISLSNNNVYLVSVDGTTYAIKKEWPITSSAWVWNNVSYSYLWSEISWLSYYWDDIMWISSEFWSARLWKLQYNDTSKIWKYIEDKQVMFQWWHTNLMNNNSNSISNSYSIKWLYSLNWSLSSNTYEGHKFSISTKNFLESSALTNMSFITNNDNNSYNYYTRFTTYFLVKHLYNWWALLLTSNLNNQDTNYSWFWYRVVYFNWQNWYSLQTINNDLTWWKAIIDADMNIYWKIVVVKWE